MMLVGPLLAVKCPEWTLKELVQISPLIVEAMVVASGDFDPRTKKFPVTFKVKKIYKGHSQKYLRMQFWHPEWATEMVPTNAPFLTPECPKTLSGFWAQNYSDSFEVNRRNPLDHKKYRKFQQKYRFLVFAKNSRLFGFEPIVSPLRRTKRARLALNKALCLHQSQYCQKGMGHLIFTS